MKKAIMLLTAVIVEYGGFTPIFLGSERGRILQICQLNMIIN